MTFLDDCFGAHEIAGNFLFDKNPMAAIYGGLVVFTAMGVVFAVLWIAGLWVAFPQDEEFHAYLLFSIYFGLLVFFGVVVDAFHTYLQEHFHLSETLLTLVEDGSEMLMLCIFAVSVFGLWCRADKKSVEHVLPNAVAG